MKKIRELSMEKILNTPMIQPNDANAKTVKHYLALLLTRVWELDESFSGKRPFGNSGWKHEVYCSLKGVTYETSFTHEEEEDMDRAILAAVRYMCL